MLAMNEAVILLEDRIERIKIEQVRLVHERTLLHMERNMLCECEASTRP